MARSIQRAWSAIAAVSLVLLPMTGETQERFRLTPESTAAQGTTADFGGTWKLRTVQNAEFELTLQVNGDQVTGSFHNTANGSYDGTLTGTAMQDGRLSFTWVQPANGGATGDGVIRVHTDGTLGGGITYKAPEATGKATYYRWYATRTSRQGGDTSGFAGMWTGANPAWGQLTVALGAGSGGNGALQGNINGAVSGFVQGQVAADSHTYGFSYQSSYMGGSTGSGAWVLSADGKSLTGNTYDSRGMPATWYLTRLETPQAAAPVATPPAAPSPVNGAYNSAVLRFAVDHLGQRLGRGECTDLVTGALAYANARPGDFSSADGHYVWGQKVSAPPQPGDIIQLVKVKLSFKTPNAFGSWMTATQHSAIVESVEHETLLHVIHQNSPIGGPVVRGDIDLGWTLEQGDYAFYRAVTP